MEKINGGTLESFIKRRRDKLQQNLKNKSEIRKIEKETLAFANDDLN